MKVTRVVVLCSTILVAAPFVVIGVSQAGDRSAKRGCMEIVHVKHPNYKDQKFQAEVEKCEADPAAYNK